MRARARAFQLTHGDLGRFLGVFVQVLAHLLGGPRGLLRQTDGFLAGLCDGFCAAK